MRFGYNKVALENGWGKFPYTPGGNDRIRAREVIGYTNFECTVVNIIDETYGKMPEEWSAQ